MLTPKFTISIILDGVGVLHKFAPINEENKPCTKYSASSPLSSSLSAFGA